MRTLLLAGALILSLCVSATAPKQEFYSIRVYQLKNKEQEARVEKYLQSALLPALHRSGISEVGVFKPIGNDTASIRKIYVLIPLKTLEQFTGLTAALNKDAQYLTDGKDYLDVNYDDPSYVRIESILLQAFPEMPRHAVPTALQGPKSERIYELRSYEGPSEKYFANKVRMFNEGGEVPLFQRLGFNAVFYASVLAGSHMPNLMYMTSFDNMASREAHWKTFGADPYWKELSGKAEYQHNVSHIDIVFLHPAEYSDL
ncbi:MAG: NIPSNAP family protein [Bacteroidetes bacterium]|nr:NIPSNAP family protein [Bacteroidota bacterium]